MVIIPFISVKNQVLKQYTHKTAGYRLISFTSKSALIRNPNFLMGLSCSFAIRTGKKPTSSFKLYKIRISCLIIARF